jgi:hypothetical protein
MTIITISYHPTTLIFVVWTVSRSVAMPIRSDLDSTRESEVPDFKNFSAYNRGPRSKVVYQILASICSQSNWLKVWKANRVLRSCRLSYASKIPAWLPDEQMLKPMCSILTYGTFLNSHSHLKLTIQYTLTVYSEVKVGWLKNEIEPRLYSKDKFVNANCQATLFIISLWIFLSMRSS